MEAQGEPQGSLLVVDGADRDAAEAFAAGDPYGKAGLFAKVTITGFRPVLALWAKADG